MVQKMAVFRKRFSRADKCTLHKVRKRIFSDVVGGYKSFEIRKNDRGYQVGDDIVLREYDKELAELTGREIRVSIIYFLADYPGIEPGYCILGIEEY